MEYRTLTVDVSYAQKFKNPYIYKAVRDPIIQLNYSFRANRPGSVGKIQASTCLGGIIYVMDFPWRHDDVELAADVNDSDLLRDWSAAFLFTPEITRKGDPSGLQLIDFIT